MRRVLRGLFILGAVAAAIYAVGQARQGRMGALGTRISQRLQQLMPPR